MPRELTFRRFDDRIVAPLLRELDRMWDAIEAQNKTIQTQAESVTELQRTVLGGTSEAGEQDTLPDTEVIPPSMYNYSPTLTALLDGKLKVEWMDWPGVSDPNVVSYDLFCSTNSSCAATDDNLIHSGVLATTYTITNLTKGITYYVRVRPNTKNGIGVESSAVSEEMSKDIGMFIDDNAPTIPGDIKVVVGAPIELDDCDAATQWSVHSGAGVTIALDTVGMIEGTGRIVVTVPAGITAVIKCTKSAGSWDLSNSPALKVYLDGWSILSGPPVQANAHFGEAAYNEQSCGLFTLQYGWQQLRWQISGIAPASKNAVTLFAVTFVNSSYNARHFGIDYVYADPGPGQVQAYDGYRAYVVSPKICVDDYVGTGAEKTIILNRKGTPAAIFIKEEGAALGPPMLWWHKNFGAGLSEFITGAAQVATGIIAVGDGYFTIGTHANINTLGSVYNYFVLWED